jgi:signal transduction histidine kinase/ligand-binding sensor domain-containing protein
MVSPFDHKLLSIILLFVAGFHLNAQSFNSHYNFKQLNVQNGLVQNIVYHFLEDSRGYMWLGTHNGVTLFDGTRTINFLHNDQDKKSISGNFISSILEDPAQQIWIGNENGINLYNRIDNSFTHFGVDRPDGSKDSTYCVLLGFVSTNELWFLDTKTRSVRSFNSKTKISSFISELNASNALLYKGLNQTIHIWTSYDKGTIHQVFRNKKLIDQENYFSGKNGIVTEPVLEVSHVLQQNDTTVWLSATEGLVKLNPVLNRFHIYNKWQKQPVTELRYSALSSKGQLWVGSGPKGIYTFDITTNQFRNNFRNNKLDPFSICSDNIVSLYFDKAGNIWCGSYGNGSSYTNIENVFFSSHVSKTETLAWESSNNISWLDVDDKGKLWCLLGNIRGFWILDKDLKIRMHKNPLLENGANFNAYMTKVLLDKNENAWCATSKGLYKYSLSSNKMHPVKYELIGEEVQGSIWIKDMIRLNDSSILFSTYVGLYHLMIEAGSIVIKPVLFLKPGEYDGFGKLYQDKANYVYVKSLAHFLYILKPGKEGKDFSLFKSIPFGPEVNNYYNEPGDTIIYIATSEGVYTINSNDSQAKRESFDNKLPFLNVNSVFKKNKKLWVFGEKGLYMFNKKNQLGRTYTVEDGLPSNEFSLSSIVFDSDQRCIAGTANGIVSFFPDQLQESNTSPVPQFLNIYINDALYSSAPNLNELKKIKLTHNQNTFSIDFSPVTFQHSTECSFEYKLDGYDETWIKSGITNHTRYSKIPPGNYVFNLRVTEATGKLSPYTKSLEIEISRAFWQTILFKIAILIIIIIIGWLVTKWYLNLSIRKQKQEFEKQQAIEKERTRIATDMHDDLGAGLSRIKFLSQSILNKKLKDEVIKTELKKITSFSDEMSEKMGEIVWALNEKNDTLADLIAYTRAYAVEYLQTHNIQCEANTPLHLPATFITGEMRRNIFLSVKECLHNIVKHSGATKVLLSIELNDKMQIIIHDNGKGMDRNHQRAFGNGVDNIEKRMKEIKGKASFKNDKGTKVILSIPLSL